MCGKISGINYVFLVVSVVAAFTDLTRGRIYNWLTVPTAGVGLLFSVYHLGWSGAAEASLGIFTGLLLYGWMFGVGFMGGGDVKLLMAFGAWGGFSYTIEVGILAILIGGVISFCILLFTGRLPGFLKAMYYFMVSIFVRELEVQVPKIDDSFKMPFGVPLAIAATWVAFCHPFPLETWGVLPWR